MPLRRRLSGHNVDTAFERGWSTLGNGALLDRAESEGYDLLLTTDQSLRHQQDFTDRQLAVIVLLAASWPRISKCVDQIRAVIEQIELGHYTEIPI